MPTDINSPLCGQCQAVQARPGQSYRLACHRTSMRAYRLRWRRQFTTLSEAVRELTVDNSDTRIKFEQKVHDRRIVVMQEPENFAAEVIGFLPQEKLLVVNESGQEVVVRLDQVTADQTRWHEPAPIITSNRSGLLSHRPTAAERRVRSLRLSSVRAVVRFAIPEHPSLQPGSVVRISQRAFEGPTALRFPATPEGDPNQLLWLRPVWLLPCWDFLRRQPWTEHWLLVRSRRTAKRFLGDPLKKTYSLWGFRFESPGELLHYLQLNRWDPKRFLISRVCPAVRLCPEIYARIKH